MSFSPSASLVRLQELKLWQGSYDNLIQKSKINGQLEDQQSRECIALEDRSNLNYQSLERDVTDPKEWDKRKISPTKPFEELLEEKLSEDTPVTGYPRPKRPFLKKGQGLARFKMSVARPVSARSENVACERQVPLKTPPAPSTVERKSILKKTNPFYHQEVDLSPLTVPDFVRQRGTWKQVFESSEKSFGGSLSKAAGDLEEEQGTLENYEEFRKSLGSGECKPITVQDGDRDAHLFKTSSSKHVLDTPRIENDARPKPNPSFGTLNKEMLQKVNEFAKTYFDGQNPLFSNDIPDDISGLTTPKIHKHLGDLTLEELKMERELKIFEVLEQRVDNSSFSSTNTSVANLLASTPHKVGTGIVKSKIIHQKEIEDANDSSIDISENLVFPSRVQEDIQMKIREVAEKTDVLQEFLRNLRSMEGRNMQDTQCTFESDTTTSNKNEKTLSTSISFSEENSRWSSRSPSLTDHYTELDTCQSDGWRKVDAGVNTSFDKLDDTLKTLEPCKGCEELRSKYSDTKMKLIDAKSENSNLKKELKDLQKEYDVLKKTRRKDGERYQEKLDELQNELDREQKRIAKEKAYFESYVKDAQNRPSKKERELITQLKQELADVKELLKLKDMKTGATQARLRTQIKQQEKEVSELKVTVDKLQRENAKLTASQKYARRPQEVKMLHEINKNLSKLTEETFKKQLNKSGNGDVEESTVNVRRKSENVNEESGDKENEKYGKNANNKEVQKSTKPRLNRDRARSDSATLDDTPLDGMLIEQEYETIFGNFDSPRNVNGSTSVEKNQRTLANGSVEIMYSNGNLKTISADGNYIKIKYFNGDTKETNLKENIIKYHYAAADSWHIQHPDGSELMEFKDGQKCTKYTDGKTEISYPDGSVRTINVDGTEEQRFPDGRRTLKNLEGEQIILLPNGQREIHSQDFKRREYPDGTIRTLRKDGSVETVYANGRVRLKDSNGVLIMDTHQT